MTEKKLQSAIDYAEEIAELCHQGKSEEAKKLLEEMQQQYPHEKDPEPYREIGRRMAQKDLAPE